MEFLKMYLKRKGFKDDEVEEISNQKPSEFKKMFGKTKSQINRTEMKRFFYHEARDMGFSSKEAQTLSTCSKEKRQLVFERMREKRKRNKKRDFNYEHKLNNFKSGDVYRRNSWFYDEIMTDDVSKEDVKFMVIDAEAGQGKTLLAVKIALQKFWEGRPIVSNVKLNLYRRDDGSVGPMPNSYFTEDFENNTYEKKRAYTFMDMETIFNKANEASESHSTPKDLFGSVVILDELHQGVDSRSSQSKENKLSKTFESQYRKFNFYFIATTQGLGKIDVRFRNAMDTHILMGDKYQKKMKNGLKKHIYTGMVYSNLKGGNVKKDFYEFDGIPIYPMFKTRQAIKPINLDEKEEEDE